MNGSIKSELEGIESGLPRFLGIRQVEVFSGFSKASVLRRIKRGEFPPPALREGNSVRWDSQSLLSWREEAMKKGKAEQERIEAEQRERERAKMEAATA